MRGRTIDQRSAATLIRGKRGHCIGLNWGRSHHRLVHARQLEAPYRFLNFEVLRVDHRARGAAKADQGHVVAGLGGGEIELGLGQPLLGGEQFIKCEAGILLIAGQGPPAGRQIGDLGLAGGHGVVLADHFAIGRIDVADGNLHFGADVGRRRFKLASCLAKLGLPLGKPCVGRTVAAQRHFEMQAAGEARPAFAELVAIGLADGAVAFQPADIGLEDRIEHGQDFVRRHVGADAGRADLLDALLNLRPGLQGRDQAIGQIGGHERADRHLVGNHLRAAQRGQGRVVDEGADAGLGIANGRAVADQRGLATGHRGFGADELAARRVEGLPGLEFVANHHRLAVKPRPLGQGRPLQVQVPVVAVQIQEQRLQIAGKTVAGDVGC